MCIRDRLTDEHVKCDVEISVMGVLMRTTTWNVHKDSILGKMVAGRNADAMSGLAAMQREITALAALDVTEVD